MADNQGAGASAPVLIMNIHELRPGSNQPYSEQYRLAAEAWVAQDSAARMLEETKTAVLSQMISQQGDIAYNKAERQVKASAEWNEFLKRMVDARTAANSAKVRLKYVEMKYFEHQSANASKRAEMRM